MNTQIETQSPGRAMTPEIKSTIAEGSLSLLENGSVVEASFSSAGEVHWYRFIYPNRPVTISLTGPTDEYSVKFFYEDLGKGGGADMHTLMPEFEEEDVTIIYQFSFQGVYNVYMSITGRDPQVAPDGEYTISMTLGS
ncbi:MAG: hypothetical protein R2911_29705 [Caldilineaceae bacterium]